MREHERQRQVAAAESRRRGLENLDAEPGDAVQYDGETWLFLEVNPRNDKVVLEQWDDMAEVNASFVEPKDG